MISRAVVIIIIMIIIVSCLAAILNTSTTTAYSPFNTDNRGYSRIINAFNARLEDDIRDLSIEEASRYVVIVPLQKRLVDRDIIDYMYKLLHGGSIVIILDEQGYSNELVKEIGLDIRVVNQTVLDEIQKYKSRYYPIIKIYIDGSNKTMSLTLFMPSYILAGKNRSSYMIGYTSKYAYADLDGNSVYSQGEHIGQYILVYGARIGYGLLIIVSDKDFITNRLLGNNTWFLEELILDRELILYTRYLDLGFLDKMKYILLNLNIIARYGSMKHSFIELMLILSILVIVSHTSKTKLQYRKLSLMSSIYIVVHGMYASLSTNNIILLSPLSILAVPYVIGRFRKYLPSIILSLAIFYTLSQWNTIPLFIPLSLLLPFIFSEEPRIKGSLTVFIGPSIFLLIKHAAALSILTLINVKMLILISILLISCLILSIAYFIALSNTRVEVLDIPKKIGLGRTAYAEFMVVTNKPLYIVLERNDGFRKIYFLNATSIVNVEIPTDHTGMHTLMVNVGVFDKWGFSRRLIKTITLRYVVVPITSKLLEHLRKRIFSREEIIKLITEVEVSLMEISSESGIPVGKGVITGTREATRIAMELLRRSKTGGLAPIGGFLQEFLHELREQWSRGYSRSGGYVSRSRLGEYVGARDYAPGDRLKDIHWKKSLSKHSLIVKEYGISGDIGSFTSKSSVLEPIVILDLFATSNVELDHMMYSLLSTYLNIVKRNPVTKSYFVLVSHNFILVIKGKSIDILYNLYKALERFLPKILYKYESISKYLEDEYVKEIIGKSYRSKPLAVLIKASKIFSNNIITALVENTIFPPKPYTLIHSRSLSFRYSILKYFLNNFGYRYIDHSSIGIISSLGIKRGD